MVSGVSDVETTLLCVVSAVSDVETMLLCVVSAVSDVEATLQLNGTATSTAGTTTLHTCNAARDILPWVPLFYICSGQPGVPQTGGIQCPKKTEETNRNKI